MGWKHFRSDALFAPKYACCRRSQLLQHPPRISLQFSISAYRSYTVTIPVTRMTPASLFNRLPTSGENENVFARGFSVGSGGATRSHRDWDFHPQSPSCGPARFHRPERVIQLVPAQDSTALKRTQRTALGVSNRGDTAPGQDSCARDWRCGIQLARRAPSYQIIHHRPRALGNLERNPFIAFRFALLPPSPRLATRVRLAFHRQPAASRVV